MEYYNTFEYEKALHYINLALNQDNNNAYYWRLKANIIANGGNEKESLKYYDKSLSIEYNKFTCEDKASVLYELSIKCLEESSQYRDGMNKINEAMGLIIRAIDTLPKESEVQLNSYNSFKNSINFYRECEIKNLEILKYNKEELFTITGTEYQENVKLTSNMPLKLVKESENKFDSDAIAIFAGYRQIGYVANSKHTKSDLTSSASQLQDKFQKVLSGEYLGEFVRYHQIPFHVGRILK